MENTNAPVTPTTEVLPEIPQDKSVWLYAGMTFGLLLTILGSAVLAIVLK